MKEISEGSKGLVARRQMRKALLGNMPEHVLISRGSKNTVMIVSNCREHSNEVIRVRDRNDSGKQGVAI